MAFEPSVDDSAPGFWDGYYRGLAYILWACILLLNGAVLGRNFLLLPYEQAKEATGKWYAFSHHSFYLTLAILLGLGALSFAVSLFIKKSPPRAPQTRE